MSRAAVLGLGASALAALPVALRAGSRGGSVVDGLLVGAAALLPALTLCLGLFRPAGRGLRSVFGPDVVRASVLRVSLFVVVALPLLAALAGVLKSVTHHRGLGGATFGVFGLAILLGSALVSHRVAGVGEHLGARLGVAGAGPSDASERPARSRVPVLVAGLGVLLLVALLGPLVRSGEGSAAPGLRAALVDGVVAIVAMLVFSQVELGSLSAHVERWGVFVAGLVLLGAGLRVETAPSVGRAVTESGGLAGGVLGALERWTDRDGDGRGSHFGGGDCDDGDPSRRPGLVDVPGDGVDQDCDSIDAPASAAPLLAAQSAAVPTAEPSTAPKSQAAPPQARPSIVLVTLDTVRADHTSAFGYDKPTTPNLEKLAEQGVAFTRAYAAGVDPQRGLSPLFTGVRWGKAKRGRGAWPTLADEPELVAERLVAAGYQTGAVSSFTWVSREKRFDQGFVRFEEVFKEEHPERGVTGPLAVRAASALLEQLGGGKEPFFLWVHLFDAHEQYQSHGGPSFGRGKVGAYDGELAFVDKQLGALVEAVRKGPKAADTWLVVHGSHGEAFGEHEEKGHGVGVHEETARVPLVLVPPPSDAGARRKAKHEGAVSVLDLAPTVLALAGAKAEGVDGTSLLGALRGAGALERPPVLVEASKRAALIDGSLKLMVLERKGKARTLLFDLASDPRETRDLSAERAADLERLLKLLEASREGSAGR